MDHPILGDMNAVREYPKHRSASEFVLDLDCERAYKALLYIDFNTIPGEEAEFLDNFVNTVELFQRSQSKPVAALLRKKEE